jgi:hypothetical protein
VDQMLSEMTPEQMDDWDAMNQVVPIGTEKVCRVLSIGFAAILDRIAWAMGNTDAKPTKPDKFIPWGKKKPKPKYVSPNAAAAAFKMAVNR